MWLWVSALSAHAQDKTVLGREEFDRMVQTALPSVGRQVGRQPMGSLKAGILTRERLMQALAQPVPFVGQDAEEARREAAEHTLTEWERQRARELGESAVAVYVPALQGVFLIKEAVEEVMAEAELSPLELKSVVRCVVAHEIVHALQDQYGIEPDSDDPDRARGALALREGHATAEGLRWCEANVGAQTARQVLELQGIDVAGTLHPEQEATPYAYGRLITEVLQREDPELLWAALTVDPPLWSEIVSDVRPQVGAGWEDPSAVRAVLGALGQTGAEPVSHGLGALSLLLDAEPEQLPQAQAGWGFYGDTVTLVATRLAEPGQAAPTLAARAAQARQPGGLVVASDLPGQILQRKIGPAPRLARSARVQDTLRIQIRDTRGSRYVEQWLATERVLLMLASSEPRPRAREQAALLASLLERLPEPVPAELKLQALAPWRERVRSARPLVRPVASPGWRMMEAAWAWRRQQPEPCVQAFSDVLQGLQLPDPIPWLRAAYRCAALAGDLETAERVAERLPLLEPGPASLHAWTLLDAGRADEALALVDRAGKAPALSGPDLVRLTDLRIAALGETGQWTEMVATARQGGSAEMRLQVAAALLERGRRTEAHDILQGACRELEPVPPLCVGK